MFDSILLTIVGFKFMRKMRGPGCLIQYAHTHTHAHTQINTQTREEGKSLLQEVVKLKKVHESTGKGGDLGLYHLDDELSPIPANPKVPEAMSN